MARTRHDGHGRCGVCGDAGAARRAKEAANGNFDLNDGIDENLEQRHFSGMPDYCGPYCPCGDPDEETWRCHPVANQNNQAPLAVSILRRLVN